MTEAEILFTEVLDCGKLDLCLKRDTVLTKGESNKVSSVLERRMRGEPLQYILGKTEFMGLEFKVTPDVLIPRPETEIVVEKALEACSQLMVGGSRLNILDIGTGSGCIAVSLAKILPQAKITATDISAKALEIAKQNAELNNVSINFIQSDLFMTYHLPPTTYDLIISNPPYISSQDITKLQPEIQYEPKIALDGGKDGLDFYRRIIAQASGYLKKNGLLIMEIGFAQGKAIKNIFADSGRFNAIELSRDYNNIDRVILAEVN